MITTSDDLQLLEKAVNVCLADRNVVRSYMVAYNIRHEDIEDFDNDTNNIREALLHVIKDWENARIKENHEKTH